MIETLLRNWIVGILFTLAMLCLLWIPDFIGYNHATLLFRVPFMGAQFDGNMFAHTGYRLITIVMALFNGFSIVILCLRFLSLGRANVIVPLYYLVLVFSYPQARLFSTAFIATLFVIFGLFALFTAGESQKTVAPLFLSSFLSGCACLLYMPSLVMVVSFIVIAVTLNLFHGRNIFVFLGGILVSVGSCIVYRYVFLDASSDSIGAIFEGFCHIRFNPAIPTPATLFMTLVFIYLVGRGVLHWLHYSLGNMSYRNRVLLSFVWMLLICGVATLLYAGVLYGYLSLLALPASILIAYYFSEERNAKRTKAEFIVLLLAIAFNQVAYFM